MNNMGRDKLQPPVIHSALARTLARSPRTPRCGLAAVRPGPLRDRTARNQPAVETELAKQKRHKREKGSPRQHIAAETEPSEQHRERQGARRS